MPFATSRRALVAGLCAVALAWTSFAAAARDTLAGRYRLHDGPDVASELILRADGRFQYFLMAGSLDEQAQGTWLVDGKVLKLTTLPKPVPAVFTAGPAAATPDGRLAIHVTDPAGRGIASVYFTLGFDSGPPVTGYTQDYGWTLPEGEDRAPRWIELSVPIHDLQPPRFLLDVSKGNAVTFILTANDLGTIDFSGMRIDIQPGRLVMHRHGTLIAYEASEPKGQ